MVGDGIVMSGIGAFVIAACVVPSVGGGIAMYPGVRGVDCGKCAWSRGPGLPIGLFETCELPQACPDSTHNQGPTIQEIEAGNV